MTLPGAAVGAVTHKPQTPRNRAAAYVAAENEEWLDVRGLRAHLVDTEELASIVGLPMTRLLSLACVSSERSATCQIHALRDYVSELEVFIGTRLSLESQTLWLLVLANSR